MNEHKIDYIIQSHVSGQFKQFYRLIKQYGVSKFHVDLFDYLFDHHPSPARVYQHLIYTYHSMKLMENKGCKL